ncbi:MAG: hypothetical protein AAF518_17500 [Spirochaetota bacterium]
MVEITFIAESKEALQKKVSSFFDLPEAPPTPGVPTGNLLSRPGFRSLSDLVYHSMNDYDQYLGCHADCLEIAAEVRNKTWSSGDSHLDKRIVKYALINDIASTLCNVNTRILLVNNFYERIGRPTLAFKDAYKKVLSGGGTQKGTLTVVSPKFYSIFAIQKRTIIRSHEIQTHKAEGRLYRIWTANGSNTHATLVICQDNRLVAIDTASTTRTGREITKEILRGSLYNRKIVDLEYLL